MEKAALPRMRVKVEQGLSLTLSPGPGLESAQIPCHVTENRL